MVKFIYDERQKKSVNLDNVDTIETDQDGTEYTITFQKQLFAQDRTLASSLEKWAYRSEEERDDMFYKIMTAGGGERLDPYIPVVA